MALLQPSVNPLDSGIIESVEYVGMPVFQHFPADIELREIELVTSVEEYLQALFGSVPVWSVYEGIELFLEGIGLSELVGEAKQNVEGDAILYGELLAMREQEVSRAFEVFSLGIWQMLLNRSTDVVQRPGAVANHMKAVDDDLGVGEEGSGDITETFIHIHDDVLDLIAVGEGLQIVLNTGHRPIGEDVKNTLRQGIGDDALELFSAGVALELVKGDGERKSRGVHCRHVLEATQDATDGGAGQRGDILCAVAPEQQFHDLQRHLMREALIPSSKGARLREAFPTFRTHESPSVVAQNQRLPA